MSLVHPIADFLGPVRQRADIEGASQNDRFPNSELVGYLNRAYGAFYRVVVDSRGGNYNVSSTALTTSSGVSVYPLNASFVKLLHVIATLNGRREWLIAFDENERAYLSDTQVGWTGALFRYSLVGGNIEFLPVPATAYAIEVRFVPNPYQWTGDADSTPVDVINLDGFNYIVDAAAKLAVEKNGAWDRAAKLDASLMQLEAAIRQSMPSRDQNMPPRIQDVSGVYGGFRQSRRRWR